MKFGNFVSFKFLIISSFFYSIKGQVNTEEKNDCTKLNNFLFGDNKTYSTDYCCYQITIECENEYITSINLSNKNSFKNENFTTFPYLINLKKLYFNDDRIKQLPDDLFKLPNLEILNIQSNNFEKIPSSISGLTKLKILRLYNNKIKTLPDELLKLPNLEELTIQNNEIETIPSSISGLTKLKELCLSTNKIKKLPDNLFKLTNLEKLILKENKIESIPPSISELKNLEQLNLGNNRIKTIPDELFELPKLKFLFLQNNKIETISSSSIDGLNKLQEYDLRNNTIKSIPDRSFKLINTENLNSNFQSYTGYPIDSDRHRDSRDSDDSRSVFYFFLCVVIIALIIKKNAEKRQALNNELNAPSDGNALYNNRNRPSEVEDDLPPYSPREDHQTPEEVNITIPNTVVGNNYTNEVIPPPPRYEDIIQESHNRN